MLNGIHSHTTNLGPRVSFDLVFMISPAGLQDWFINTSTAGNDANHGSVGGGDHLFRSGRQLDPGPLGVDVVGDDGGVVS